MRAAVLLIGLTCLGCHSRSPRSYTWSYTPEPPKTRAPRIAGSVAVPPAIDQRSDARVDNVGFDIFPLVPFGWYEYARPERTEPEHLDWTLGDWRFQPSEDIAKAVAAELAASGLFDEVFYASPAPKGTLVLSVTIESTLAEGRIITYGLSMAGPVLWLFGLPSGTLHSDLKLAFELTDQVTGRSLWSARCERSFDDPDYGLYDPTPGFQYDTMLKDMLVTEVLPALEYLSPTP